MNCIIIDDEKHCIGTLEVLLSNYYPEINVVATCNNGLDGIAAISQFQPDFIFLDISMPKMDGFEMLSRIPQPLFKIIFTTAFDNYAIKAFKVSAVDYLLKPIDKAELGAALERVKKQVVAPKLSPSESFVKDQLELFLENIRQKNNSFPNIAIPTMDGMEMVKLDNIYYIESDSNYSIIHFKDKSSLTTTRPLKDLESSLSMNNFIRIHRSYIINLIHLDKYHRGEGGYVILNNGIHLDVSRRRKEGLLNRLKSY